MNELVIDAFDFCKRAQRREGKLAVSDLDRLARETVDGAGTVEWRLEGGRNRTGHPQLSLAIASSVNLQCQRCLLPLAFQIESISTLILAPDESSADEMEELVADEDLEVIVGSVAMNIVELIEDEALLALPQSPRHAACVDTPAAESPERPSPFAVLKTLKH